MESLVLNLHIHQQFSLMRRKKLGFIEIPNGKSFFALYPRIGIMPILPRISALVNSARRRLTGSSNCSLPWRSFIVMSLLCRFFSASIFALICRACIQAKREKNCTEKSNKIGNCAYPLHLFILLVTLQGRYSDLLVKLHFTLLKEEVYSCEQLIEHLDGIKGFILSENIVF